MFSGLTTPIAAQKSVVHSIGSESETTFCHLFESGLSAGIPGFADLVSKDVSPAQSAAALSPPMIQQQGYSSLWAARKPPEANRSLNHRQVSAPVTCIKLNTSRKYPITCGFPLTLCKAVLTFGASSELTFP